MAGLEDIVEFYAILDRLKKMMGGERSLSRCTGRMAWPERGVYFFMEAAESRSTRRRIDDEVIVYSTTAFAPSAPSKVSNKPLSSGEVENADGLQTCWSGPGHKAMGW